MLDQTLGFLNHHLRHGHVARRRFVKGRGHHFTAHTALHIGHFLGPFVDQQHDQIALRVIGRDRMGDVLQQHRLTRPRRCHDQGALTLPDRADQINDPGRAVLHRRVFNLHLQPLIRIKRRQVVEVHLVARLFRIIKVDLRRLDQAEIALILARRLNDALNGIPRPQRKLPDHLGTHIDIIRSRQIVGRGAPQEPKPVLQHFQHTVAADLPAFLGMLFQDREHHLALAHRRRVLNLPFLGHRQQLSRRLCLQISKIQMLDSHRSPLGSPKSGDQHIGIQESASGRTAHA